MYVSLCGRQARIADEFLNIAQAADRFGDLFVCCPVMKLLRPEFDEAPRYLFLGTGSETRPQRHWRCSVSAFSQGVRTAGVHSGRPLGSPARLVGTHWAANGCAFALMRRFFMMSL